MSRIGLSQAQVSTVLRVIGASLLLGEVTFEGAEEARTVGPIHAVAQLIGVAPQALAKALTFMVSLPWFMDSLT